MPRKLTAYGGIDAVTHALESYVSCLATEFTQGLSREALKLLFEHLPSAYKNGENDPVAREKVRCNLLRPAQARPWRLDAARASEPESPDAALAMVAAACAAVVRTQVHYASTIAGMAFANAFLGICHSMAHKLGAAFHVPHGLANALLISHVIAYNATDSPFKQATFSQYQFPHAKAAYAEVADFLGLSKPARPSLLPIHPPRGMHFHPSCSTLLPRHHHRHVIAGPSALRPSAAPSHAAAPATQPSTASPVRPPAPPFSPASAGSLHSRRRLLLPVLLPTSAAAVVGSVCCSLQRAHLADGSAAAVARHSCCGGCFFSVPEAMAVASKGPQATAAPTTAAKSDDWGDTACVDGGRSGGAGGRAGSRTAWHCSSRRRGRRSGGGGGGGQRCEAKARNEPETRNPEPETRRRGTRMSRK